MTTTQTALFDTTTIEPSDDGTRAILEALTHAYRDWVSAEALHARACTPRTKAAAVKARATYDTTAYTLLGGAL